VAYMNQERKAKIAEQVKPILARYGMKGTLKTDKHSITLTLKSGSIDFINDLNNPHPTELRKDYALSVNPYWFQEHYSGESYHFLKEIMGAMKAADWYDKSDPMIDYFSTAYYYNVNIGNWQKPYIVTN